MVYETKVAKIVEGFTHLGGYGVEFIGYNAGVSMVYETKVAKIVEGFTHLGGYGASF